MFLIFVLLLSKLVICCLNFSKSVYWSPEVTTYELVYGDLGNLESFFVLKNDSETRTESPETPEIEENRRVIAELLAQLEDGNEEYPSGGPDTNDLNTIREGVTNLTRRQRTTKGKYEKGLYIYDYDDYYDEVRNNTPTEGKKKRMLVMINLQFLIHTRKKVREAVDMRRIAVKDKRYRLGYLFSRLRKLLTEQRKVATGGEGNRWNTYDLHDLYTLMRMYERVVRYDVDIRDTADHIRRTYAETADFDKFY